MIDVEQFRVFIAPVLRTVRYAKLKKEFYDILIADLVDVSASVEYKKENDLGSNIEYALDAIVEDVDGCFYRSLLATNTADLTETSAWDKLDKFTTDCYNNLWENGLSFAIANDVALKAKPRIDNKFDNIGSHTIKDDFISSSYRARSTVSKSFIVDSNEAWEHVQEYIKEFKTDNPTSTCFTKYEVECQQQKTTTGRRLVWGY